MLKSHQKPVQVKHPALCRKQPVTGKSDWYVLDTNPDFHICPVCYQEVILPAGYSDSVSPQNPELNETSIKCDLASGWFCIVWMRIRQTSRPSLTLLSDVKNMAVIEGGCPNDSTD
jgi:hypothetical protein